MLNKKIPDLPPYLQQSQIIPYIKDIDIDKVRRIHQLARIYYTKPSIDHNTTEEAFKNIKNSNTNDELTQAISNLFDSVNNEKKNIDIIKNACFILVNQLHYTRMYNKVNTVPKIELKDKYIIKIIELLSLTGLCDMQRIIESFGYTMTLLDEQQFQLNDNKLQQIILPNSSTMSMLHGTSKEAGKRTSPLDEEEMRHILSLLHVDTIQTLLSKCRTMYTRKKPVYTYRNADVNQLLVI